MPQQIYYSQPYGQHGVGQDFLRSNPRATFQSFLPELSMPMRRHYGYRYDDLYGQYLGQLGQEIRSSGGLPSLQFQDFLGNYPWLQEYMGIAPRARGSYQNRYAPRARFLNF